MHRRHSQGHGGTLHARMGGAMLRSHGAGTHQHRDVAPRGRPPVRVVVPLFRAFGAGAVAVGVLAGIPGIVPVVHVPIGGEESLVPATGPALLVPVDRLVLAELRVERRVCRAGKERTRASQYLSSQRRRHTVQNNARAESANGQSAVVVGRAHQ